VEQKNASRPILVMGIGNVLMGDEGVGVHTVRKLEEAEFLSAGGLLEMSALLQGVTLLDGGTGGFNLLSYLEDFPVVVIIDATLDGNPPGTIRVLRPRHSAQFPVTLSAHDIGLKDLVESAQLLGHLPEIHLVAVSIGKYPDMGMELSPPIEECLPRAARSVLEVLQALQNGEAPEGPRAGAN